MADGVSLRVKGQDEIQSIITEVAHELSPKGAAKIMQLAMGMLHRYAANITPVDTGRLKNSETIGVNIQGRGVLGLVYTANVEYAPFVERRARFFEKTVEREGPDAMALFDENIGDVLGG